MTSTSSRWTEMITHDDIRQHFQFVSVFLIMAFISTFMTVMNFFTGWTGALMQATLIFAVLNIINAGLEYFGGTKLRLIPRTLFAVEIVVLFTFFVLNGQPKGFSTLWAALLPTCGLLLYKGKIGSLISGIQFVILAFLFWFPAGQDLLLHPEVYTDVFMMRFPVLYAAFFLVGLFFEIVRHFTQKELTTARDRYKDTSLKVMHVLADEFPAVFSVDFDTDSIDVYSGREYFDRSLAEMPFSKSKIVYRDTVVTEDYREIFDQFFSDDNIRRSLREDHSPALTYAAILNGKEHYLQAKLVKVPNDEGGIHQMIVAFSDVDAYVREQERTQQELRVERTKAEIASKAKTDFLFNMSHDIRTPMNAILGFTDMAINDIGNPDKVRENLGKVRLSGNMLLTLINDILDMSRIESGKATVDLGKVDLRDMLDNIRSVMANLAASKNITLAFDGSGIRDRHVYADISRVSRILVNLVSNGIKYTEGGGRVQVWCEQLDDDEPGRATYRFAVKDNGIGMSEEFQAQMFDAFAREENTTTKGVQGTGLGLPLAKKLSEMMGGSISCESRKGIGSIFYVTLPFILQTPDEIAEENADEKAESEVDFSGRRVLVVEDNELNGEIAKYILEEKGMVTESAMNGKEAVKMVADNAPGYYDFILMDIQMPIMNGYEAAEQIRKKYSEAELPIIALSANAFEEDRQKSYASGMNDHVSKPIDVAVLMHTLAKYL